MVLLTQFEPLDSAARYQGGGIPKGFVIVTVLVLQYVLPTILAWKRQSRRRWKITAINLLLGWTIVGWIVSMVMVFAYEAPLDGDAPDQPHQPRLS